MAYTSVIPVHRLDRSIEYVKDKEKTTQKADSLEAAIDYAMNRTKTEQAVFEDTSDVPMKMRMQIWWKQKRDSIRWAVWKDTIWYRVLQKVR